MKSLFFNSKYSEKKYVIIIASAKIADISIAIEVNSIIFSISYTHLKLNYDYYNILLPKKSLNSTYPRFHKEDVS